MLGLGLSIVGQWRLEWGALAVLGFAPLYFLLDRELTPELFVGPCVMIYAYHALGYALGPVAQVYLVSYTTFVEAGFVPAQWGCVVGLATFALVYPTVFRFKSQPINANEADRALVSIPGRQWKQYGLFMLGWSAFIIAFGYLTGAQRRLGAVETTVGMQTLVAAFISARHVVWFFLGFCAVRFGRRWTWFWLVSIIPYSAYVFLDGSRGWVVYAFVMSANGAALAGVSTRKLALGLIVFVIAFSPFAAIISDYRISYRGGDLSVTDRAAHFQTIAGEYFTQYDQGALGWMNTILWQSTAHWVDRIFLLTPNVIPYAGLQDLGRLLYIYTPRVLLPNRPNPRTGGETACLYAVASGAMRSDDPTCGIGDYIPTVGEGYRRFGWVGIPLMYVVLAVVYGWILRQIWLRRSRVEWAAMLIVVMTASAEVWGTPLVDIFYIVGWEFPKYFIFFWVVRWLLDKFVDKPDRLPYMHRSATSFRGQWNGW